MIMLPGRNFAIQWALMNLCGLVPQSGFHRHDCTSPMPIGRTHNDTESDHSAGPWSLRVIGAENMHTGEPSQ